MSKHIHFCVDVRGTILRLTRSRAKRAAGIVRADGQPMRREEAIHALMDALAEGCDVLPIGSQCEGFDFKKGCPGHDEIADAAEQKAKP